jgi:hypothetical protein
MSITKNQLSQKLHGAESKIGCRSLPSKDEKWVVCLRLGIHTGKALGLMIEFSTSAIKSIVMAPAPGGESLRSLVDGQASPSEHIVCHIPERIVDVSFPSKLLHVRADLVVQSRSTGYWDWKMQGERPRLAAVFRMTEVRRRPSSTHCWVHPCWPAAMFPRHSIWLLRWRQSPLLTACRRSKQQMELVS